MLKQIASCKFIATALSPYFLAECIGIIGLVSKSLQRANITYCHAKAQIDAATSAVTKLLTSPGPSTIEIFNSMPEEESACGYSAYKTQNKWSRGRRRGCPREGDGGASRAEGGDGVVRVRVMAVQVEQREETGLSA